MTRVIILIILSCYFQFVSAQTANVKKAKDYYEEYIQSKKIDKIESALKYIQDAMSEEKALKSEYTFFYYGIILKAYNDNIGDDKKSVLNIHNAIEHLKKSLELNPKFDEKDNVLTSLKFLGYDLYREGITMYNAKNYQNAYDTYKSLVQLYDYLKSNGTDFKYTNSNNETSDLSFSDINNNYLVFAINAGKQKEATEILKSDLKSNPSPTKYLQIIQLLGQSGDSLSKETYLNEAYAKYPDNIDILIGSINSSLDKNEQKNAVVKLEKAIKIDPKNPKLYQILGSIYEQEKNIELAKSNYLKGLELLPNDYTLNYSMGALYYNLGVDLYKMTSKNDKSKSYKSLFQDAKKYFEKCKTIDPSKQGLDKLLSKINAVD